MRFFTAALLTALFLAGCSGPSYNSKVDLVQELEFARTEQLVGPKGEAGDFKCRPFLSAGFRPSWKSPHLAQVQDGQDEVSFNFLLHHPAPVRVDLRGYMPSNVAKQGKVRFFINDQFLGEQILNDEWRAIKFELPAGDLKVGVNKLQLRSAAGTAWGSVIIKDALEGEAVSTESEPAALVLPFKRQVDFPLSLRGASRLRFQLQTRHKPGVAPLNPGEWQLEVAARGESPAFQKSWTFNSTGSQTVSLPRDAGAIALSLKATHLGPQAPLPGQLGLALIEPVVEYTATEPAESPDTSPTPAEPPSPQHPNIVLFVVDTLRADRMSVYGYDKPTTSILEEFAKDAVVFEEAYAQSPWTKPSVASILTSNEPPEHGVIEFADKLPQDRLTLAEILQENRYKTLAVWTNGLLDKIFDFNQGYDQFEFLGNKVDAPTVVRSGLDKLNGLTGEHPFFLHLHVLDPHTPYTPPKPQLQAMRTARGLSDDGTPEALVGVSAQEAKKLEGESQRAWFENREVRWSPGQLEGIGAAYDGEIISVDNAFGMLLRYLKEHDLYDKTMIVLVADHGEQLFDHKRFGHLNSIHREVVRVPLIVKFPNSRGKGTRVEEVWQQIDIVPTILQESGISLPSTVRGIPYRPGMPTPPPRLVYTSIEAGRTAVAAGQTENNYLEHLEGLRLGNIMLATTRASTAFSAPRALYDLAGDPGEKTDLYWERPVTALHLEALMKRHQASIGSSKPTERVEPEKVRNILEGLQYLDSSR